MPGMFSLPRIAKCNIALEDHGEGTGVQMESDHLHWTCCPAFEMCIFHFHNSKSQARVSIAASRHFFSKLLP